MFTIKTASILQRLLVNVKCLYIMSIFHLFYTPCYTLKRATNKAV